MDVVKLPKKVRMVCYEIMDGKEGALDTLESFADKTLSTRLWTLSTRLCKRSHKIYESQPCPHNKSSIPRMTPQFR